MKKVNKSKQKSSPANIKLIAAGILLLTFIVYVPSFNNQLTNWDDNSYLKENPMVKSLSGENVGKMFSVPGGFVMGNYHPLAILSYAIEYSLTELKPQTFHFTNLLLHLANTLLVLLFIYRLTGRDVRSAGVAAALFGLHPMHVESVAWISERKDVLYTFFFLASLIVYLRYTDTLKIKLLFYSIGLFLLSILSKGQAVVLAPILLLVDFYLGRKPGRKVILEKIPFFILALVFGLIAVQAQKSIAAVNEIKIPFSQSIFFGSYGLLLYVVKAIVPFTLSAFHPYYFNEGGTLPLLVYLSPVLILAFAIYAFVKQRASKDFVFGLLFFLFAISIVLQFLPVGKTMIAERYTYVPYIGLFFIAGRIFSVHNNKTINYIILGALVVFSVISFRRMSVWKDSITLWTDVLEKYPKAEAPLSDRSFAYLDANDLQAALDDSRRLTELNPNSPAHFNQYGYVLNLNGRYDEAISELTKGIGIDPAYYRLYVNRGVSYSHKQMYNEAVKDYSKAIGLNPGDAMTYLNRGGIYTDNLNRPEEGMKDFKKVLELQPNHLDAMINIGVACYKLQKFDEAIVQFDQVLKRDPKNAKAYYMKAISYNAKGDFMNAYNNALQARSLGYNISQQDIDAMKAKAGAPH